MSGDSEIEDVAYATVRGEEGDYLGAAVAGRGDYDGDGIYDLMVATPGDATGGEWAGAMLLYNGLSFQ